MATANSINLPALTSGYVITSQGAGAQPTGTIQTAVGGMVLLNTYNASSSSSIDITSQITATYDSYRIIVSNLTAATAAVNLLMEFSSNNGSTWDTTAAHYGYNYTTQNGTTVTGGGNSSDTSVKLLNAMNNSSTASFALNLISPDIVQVSGFWTGFFTNNSSSGLAVHGSFTYLGGTTINAVRFIMSSGNIATGKFQLYGYTA